MKQRMKKAMQHNHFKSTALIFAILSIFSIAEVALANSGAVVKPNRRMLDSTHPLAKAVVLVDQVAGKSLPANGFIVGEGGCYVLTNFHVAFGKEKDEKGQVIMIDDVRVNHELRVSLDFDSKIGKFTKGMKAKVIEFGNFESDSRRAFKEDYALLRLETCLGPGYGITAFEKDAEKKRFPEGRLSTVALTFLDGKIGIVMEEDCPVFDTLASRPSAIDPLTGIIGTNCTLPPGTSGSMLLAKDSSGNFRVVGINRGSDAVDLGDGKLTKVMFAVFARQFNKVLATVLGEGPFTGANVAGAGDRKPQADQTAMANGRTIVR